MARILTRPMFRKGGLSQTARPSYRGGGVTAIRPGYRGGGMNGIMSGIVPRRGYADGPATPEEILERIQVQGLPYLTLPKIEDKYQSFIKRQDPITFPEEGALVSGYGEGKEALYDFYQTPQGEKYFKEPLIEKMKKQVAERKAKGLDVSDDAIVEEPEKTTTENELDTSGVVDTRSDFERIFNEYLPVIQDQLKPDEDSAIRDRYLALAKFGTSLMGQPGGDLAGAVGRASQKPLDDLGTIAAQERKDKQTPKLLALQATLEKMKQEGKSTVEKQMDFQKLTKVAEGISKDGQVGFNEAFEIAQKKKAMGPEGGKYNSLYPETKEKLKKIKGPKFYYTVDGELKVVKNGKTFTPEEWAIEPKEE